MGHPTIYPTGVTLYDPERSWNGYTTFQAAGVGELLIDMNGREVQLWSGLHGFPNKLLPGGQVFGSTGERNPLHGAQDQLDLVQVDWNGNVVWRFDRLEYLADPGEAGLAVELRGAQGYAVKADFCVAPVEDGGPPPLRAGG